MSDIKTVNQCAVCVQSSAVSVQSNKGLIPTYTVSL